MHINKSELLVVVDVDGTLISTIDPYFAAPTDLTAIQFNYFGTEVKRVPMIGNIELLKAWKKRGYHITVHSANGWEWALEVVTKLELQDYVDVVATKPIKCLDDLEPNQWLPQVFVKDF